MTGTLSQAASVAAPAGVPALIEHYIDGAWTASVSGDSLVRVASADPGAAPLIDPRVLSAPEDLEALAAAVELCRGIATQPALRDQLGARELYPGSLASTVERTRDYVRETVVTYHHQSGTCAMGWHEDAVVDPRLRVHGVTGLTVADASVMPLVTTGNTNAPAAMIGERAAEFILSGG